jgi:hypothetical protein
MKHDDTERLARRIERMAEVGRITKDEADGLRAAQAGERDRLIRAIRLRHAQARLDAAADQGQVTKEEADEILRCLAEGRKFPNLRSKGAQQPGPSPGLGP